jgi:hypothetical protein
MTSTMMMDRTNVQGTTPTMPGMGQPGTNFLMVPRCTYKFEKTKDGIKVVCLCEDPMARSMMQNLCTALLGGMCTCVCTLNGVNVCTVNLTMGLTRCEMTDTGCTITCTTGDEMCCKMIQSCCDCLMTLCNAGCTCCVLINNTPICCGFSESQVKATTRR